MTALLMRGIADMEKRFSITRESNLFSQADMAVRNLPIGWAVLESALVNQVLCSEGALTRQQSPPDRPRPSRRL